MVGGSGSGGGRCGDGEKKQKKDPKRRRRMRAVKAAQGTYPPRTAASRLSSPPLWLPGMALLVLLVLLVL